MLILGLTGGIATGKSTVSQQLSQAGFPVIDADLVAREVVAPGTKLLATIQKQFGQQMVVDGHLDRQRLGKLVFSDSAALKALNALMQPAISEDIRDKIALYKRKQTPVLVLDVPLLFERGPQYLKLVDRVVVVTTSPDRQLERLKQRNHLTTAEARQRIDAQLPLAQKVAQADWVIYNDGDLHQLAQQVDQLIERLRKED